MNLLLVWLLALAPLGAYNQGNRLYAQKDYAGAALAYREALKAGPSVAVRFNLGNAEFKAGRIGRAILEYRRARALDPRDADIAANLAFARAYRVDKVLVSEGPLARALDDALHRLSLREAAILASLGFFLGCLALGGWIVRRWPVLLVAASVLGALALYAFVAQRVWAAELAGRPGVVVVPEVNALSGPGEEFKQILLVHDGTEVRIREARGDYLLVQLPGGGGWVPKSSIEPVY